MISINEKLEAIRKGAEFSSLLERVKALKEENKKLGCFDGGSWDVIERMIESGIRSRQDVVDQYDAQMRLIEEDKRKKAEAEELLSLKNEAVVFLLQRGKKVIEDFLIENALEAANELAFEEECKRRKSLIDGLIEFDGNDDDCAGWDGIDGGRCSCGNRRVCWSRCSSHSFKTPCVAATSY